MWVRRKANALKLKLGNLKILLTFSPRLLRIQGFVARTHFISYATSVLYREEYWRKREMARKERISRASGKFSLAKTTFSGSKSHLISPMFRISFWKLSFPQFTDEFLITFLAGFPSHFSFCKFSIWWVNREIQRVSLIVILVISIF